MSSWRAMLCAGRGGLAAAALGLALAPASLAHAFQLVTPQEAALPAADPPTLALRGSPTRRPNVTVVSPPAGAGLVHSPLALKIKFHAFGGAAIDPDSVIVTYLKQPAIDVTQRLAKAITADGVELDQVEAPPGAHHFWVEVKDNSGRIGAAELSFTVAP